MEFAPNWTTGVHIIGNPEAEETTYKTNSILNFGKYKGCQTARIVYCHSDYMKWVYHNCKNISAQIKKDIEVEFKEQWGMNIKHSQNP